MIMSEDKKVAFITGANRGVGLEAARELGRKGIKVVLGSRDAAKGEAAAAELRREGIDAEALVFDAGKPESERAAYDHFEKRYGKLDILVNNAGVTYEPLLDTASITSIAPETLRATFETNFFAVVTLTQRLLPLIRKSPAGRIVNVSSILGSLTLHAAPNSPIERAKPLAYNASKSALNAFTVHLAHVLKDTPIKVNSAHPGWVKTELGGESAPMEVSEGGKTSALLATLPADGPTGGFFHLNERLPW
jgi:NAD(P)-dependent dehydrogenase (short-subunit alcohol dehydrogenase family)